MAPWIGKIMPSFYTLQDYWVGVFGRFSRQKYCFNALTNEHISYYYYEHDSSNEFKVYYCNCGKKVRNKLCHLKCFEILPFILQVKDVEKQKDFSKWNTINSEKNKNIYKHVFAHLASKGIYYYNCI